MEVVDISTDKFECSWIICFYYGAVLPPSPMVFFCRTSPDQKIYIFLNNFIYICVYNCILVQVARMKPWWRINRLSCYLLLEIQNNRLPFYSRFFHVLSVIFSCWLFCRCAANRVSVINWQRSGKHGWDKWPRQQTTPGFHPLIRFWGTLDPFLSRRTTNAIKL